MHTRAHTQMLSSICTNKLLLRQTTHTHHSFLCLPFSPISAISHSFHFKASYLRRSLLSCHLHHHPQQNGHSTCQTFPPACSPLGSEDIIAYTALKSSSSTTHAPCLALSGTWLMSLCGFVSLSMHHVFHCPRLPAAGPNKSRENPESSR